MNRAGTITLEKTLSCCMCMFMLYTLYCMHVLIYLQPETHIIPWTAYVIPISLAVLPTITLLNYFSTLTYTNMHCIDSTHTTHSSSTSSVMISRFTLSSTHSEYPLTLPHYRHTTNTHIAVECYHHDGNNEQQQTLQSTHPHYYSKLKKVSNSSRSRPKS